MDKCCHYAKADDRFHLLRSLAIWYQYEEPKRELFPEVLQLKQMISNFSIGKEVITVMLLLPLPFLMFSRESMRSSSSAHELHCV